MAMNPRDDFDRDILDIIPERFDADADSRQARAGHRLRTYLTLGVAVVAVGVIVATGLHFLGGKRAGGPGIPVIKADDRPIKIRPDDRGGMQVPNQDKLVYERMDQGEGDAKVERLLPAPEQPQVPVKGATQPEPVGKSGNTEVLRPGQSMAPPRAPAPEVARPLTQSAAVPQAVPPAVPESAPAAAGNGYVPTAARTAAEPVAAAPAKSAAAPVAAPAKAAVAAPDKAAVAAPAKAAVPPPAAPVKPAAPAVVAAPAAPPKVTAAPPPAAAAPTAPPKTLAGGDWLIQLGALRTAPDADKEWGRIQRANHDLLGSLKPDVVRVELGEKGTFWRLRAGPLSEHAAKQLCNDLKSRNQGCIVARK